MTRAKGYCDLNISATDPDLKATVLKALSLGYQTIAVNRYVTDTLAGSVEKEGGSKKRKKGHESGNESLVPPPVKLNISAMDLQRHKITREPIILSRITITHSDPASPFLSKYAGAIRQYDLIAITPENDVTLKQIVWSKVVDVDIISLVPETSSFQLSRSLLRSAIERDIYFEICYGPCLTDIHARKQTIALSHFLHRTSRSGNIIITSQAKNPKQLRYPYDIINVGKFLGLSEFAAKAAIANMAHNCIYCATARRRGVSKCAVQINIIDQDSENGKYEGLENASEYLKATTCIPDNIKKKKRSRSVENTVVTQKKAKKKKSKGDSGFIGF